MPRAKFKIEIEVELNDRESCKGCCCSEIATPSGEPFYFCIVGHYAGQVSLKRPKSCKANDRKQDASDDEWRNIYERTTEMGVSDRGIRWIEKFWKGLFLKS